MFIAREWTSPRQNLLWGQGTGVNGASICEAEQPSFVRYQGAGPFARVIAGVCCMNSFALPFGNLIQVSNLLRA